MVVYILVKTDFRHKTNIGVFDTQAKALAAQTAIELANFDSGELCGVNFYIEEHLIR